MSPPPEEQAASDPTVPPVRVAWVAGRGTFDRLSAVLRPLAVGLMDEVVEVLVLCPASADGSQVPSTGHEVLRYRDPRWWRPGRAAAAALAAELRRRKVELLHALDGSATRLTRSLARAAGLPYALSSDSLADADHVGEPAREAGAVLAASEPIRQAFLRRAHCPPEKVHCMRPGVYHVRHPTCFGEPDQTVAIVAGGALGDFPAFDAVMRCFAELSARKLDCVYFILGGGRAERLLRARTIQLGLSHDLTFVDRQPLAQLTGIFKAADLYVSPAAGRELDMCALLAIAAGVPVLATAAGASDFLRDGETAMFFRQGDSAELTVKLGAMLDDRAATRAQAESALRYIHEQHSPANNVTALAHIYRQAVARPAGRK
jgi:glycosyltransferase involved in cell wall biosynthesis